MCIAPRLVVCALVGFGWLGCATHAAAQGRKAAAALTPVAIVSAVDDCLGGFLDGKLDAAKLTVLRWHSQYGEMEDGTVMSIMVRDDGAALSLFDSGCIVKNPLAADSSIDALSAALTNRFAMQPRRAGGDLRWILPIGLVQIHRKGGWATGTYQGVIVQVRAATNLN